MEQEVWCEKFCVKAMSLTGFPLEEIWPLALRVYFNSFQLPPESTATFVVQHLAGIADDVIASMRDAPPPEN